MNVLKFLLSWSVVFYGFIVSVLTLGLFGTTPAFADFSVSWWRVLESVVLLVVGVAALSASLLAFKNRKMAACIYLVSFPLVAAISVFVLQKRELYPNPFGIVLSTLLLGLPGLFWLLAHRYQWPSLTTPRESSARTKTFTIAAGVLYCVLVWLTSLHLAVSWEFPGDCGYDGTPFIRPYAGRALFVARIVHVDPVIGAVAIVEDRFGGLSRWTKVVLFKGGRTGQTYFADGRLDEGLLTRWPLPVVDLKCTGSTLIEDAQVELRLLKQSPRWEGVRIIGRAEAMRPGSSVPSGMKVIITGPSGTVVATTDRDGIYDVSGLAPGHYSVRADVPPNEVYHDYAHCKENREPVDLKPGDVWGCTLRVW